MRDLQAEWTEEAIQRITTENTTLKQRIRQLTTDNRTLDERLKGRTLQPPLPRPTRRRSRSPPHRSGFNDRTPSGYDPQMSVARDILVLRRRPGTAARGE
ncbi:hypothetical protein AB0D46_05770 [Streptomyces sp. NPDC048383]|uniref:hypothetical protein n=1 Tax=Streptomyces sp. NPDC048383 TaxID=3155386 RepID=UPI00341267BE